MKLVVEFGTVMLQHVVDLPNHQHVSVVNTNGLRHDVLRLMWQSCTRRS